MIRRSLATRFGRTSSRDGIALVLVYTTAMTAAACGSGGTQQDPTFTLEQLKDPTTCQPCHVQQFKDWSGSMHAYASKDPVFLAMNARGQRETKQELGNFCVRCHAPMVYESDPSNDGTSLDTMDPKLQGITCYFCHQVKDVTDTHNAALVLANDTTMRGGISDPQRNNAHHSAYSPLHDGTGVVAGHEFGLESAKLCGTCHDIVVPAHFSGASQDVALERTYQEWIPSVFDQTGPRDSPLACGSQGCHTRPSPGNVYTKRPVATQTGIPGVNVPNRDYLHPHDFPGVDIALTDFPDRDHQRKAVVNMLSNELTVQLCMLTVPNVVAQVTLENVGAGHNIPSGASQDRRMWVEMRAYDDKDRELYRSGYVPPGRSVTNLLDPSSDIYDANFAAPCVTPTTPCDPTMLGSCRLTCDLLRDAPVDAQGNVAHMFWNVASVPPDNRQTMGVPLTNDRTNTAVYHMNKETGVWNYPIVTPTHVVPTRVTVTIHVQPIGLDVIQDLVASKDLDPSSLSATGDIVDAGTPTADGGSALALAMPTFDILPNATINDAGIAPAGSVTVEWNPETVKETDLQIGTATCVRTAPLPQ